MPPSSQPSAPVVASRARTGVATALAALAVLGGLVTAAPATAAPATAAPATTAPAAVVLPALRVTPTGGGKRDGSTWEDAGALSDVPRFVRLRPEGGEVWLRSDAGPYRTTSTIILNAGGQPGRPVVVRGVDTAGQPAAPVLLGTRAVPYSSTGAKGSEVFRLVSGANYLRFSHLRFENQGNGCLRIGADVTDVTVEDVTASNVGRFVEDLASSPAVSASVNGLVLRRVTVSGFSKSVLRLQYASRNVLLEDVVGDSQRQDRDGFAMGVHLDGSVSAVVLRRVRMDNATDTTSAYWNGDGFATERGVSNVLFEDTSASGNTDGGYDLKSTTTVLRRATASDNKRNFRLWATDTVIESCTGLHPLRRGGTGTQAQVQMNPSAAASVRNCTLTDTSPATTVFDLHDQSVLSVATSPVATAGRYAKLEAGARLTVDGTPVL